ncbi:MAG TPA: response regulator [Thermomicrobiaceae bacterium]|nr:response regulator [Thermomicrobiaceae bacterium]
MTLRALVVSQHKIFRHDLARYVQSLQPAVEVIDEVVGACQALDSVATLQPELVLLDLALRPGSALELAGRIRCQSPATAVVVVGNEPAADYRDLALEAGALDYVDVLELGAQLPAALRLVERLSTYRAEREEAPPAEPEEAPQTPPLARLRQHLCTSPTGPKHGPYTAWQYVHLCLALALLLLIMSLHHVDASTQGQVVVLLSIVVIAVLELRQLARARPTTETVRCR